jgi:hypothetical protein
MDDTNKLIRNVSVEFPQGAPEPRTVPRRWRLVDRLGEQTLLSLLEDSRKGVPVPLLVQRYGISRSSVKQLLRTHLEGMGVSPSSQS